MKFILIVNLIIEIVLTCFIPYAKSIFFDQLGVFSSFAWYGLLFYAGIYVLLDVVQNFKPLLITLYTNIKRNEYTQHYFEKGYDNPTRSQRIQEDIKLFLINQISVYSEYFISGMIVLVLILQNISYPFLIVSSVIYSVVCLCSSLLFKPKMINAEKEIQQAETNFRDVVREEKSWHGIKELVQFVIGVNKNNAVIKFNYGLCVKLQTGIMTFLPYFYLLPMYLTKQISLGIMMEQAVIFQLLVINMIILTQLFPNWMQAKASKERLEELN